MEVGGERTGVRRPRAQAVEDRPPRGIGDGTKGIRLGAYPGHDM
jgi:hypothetical protein